jgi:DNA polymerase
MPVRLDLDERQRAMLQEMRVPVWWPLPAAPAPEVATGEAWPAKVPDAARPIVAARAVPAAARPEPVPVPWRDAALGDMDLAALGATIATCRACDLCTGRKGAVFPQQAVQRQADWMVVGDPPTEEDERAGAAFAGPAGVLIDNMLRAVQRTRDGVGADGAWLTPVVKCRPALVRNPQPDELACCAQYLRREVALVQPRVILAMGRFAALSLLAATDPASANVPFGKLRGRLHHFEGVPVVVTYSPARLLRAQDDKAGAWADLCLAQASARPALEAGR